MYLTFPLEWLEKALLLCFFYTWCLANNEQIDVKTNRHVVFEGPRNDTLFGFSVAFHLNRLEQQILVGAPLEGGSGEVFRCEIKKGKDNCKAESLEQDGGQPNQWLGASVSSAGGDFLACAPRFSEEDPPKHFMVGKCITGFRKEVLNPCSGTVQARDRSGFCQAGFDAELLSRDNALIGAVGDKEGNGSIWLKRGRLAFVQPPSDQIENGYYFGYSMTYGHFYTRGKTATPDIAAGAVRSDLTGKVLIYNFALSEVRENVFPPKKVRESYAYIYFGASICAVDLNGDGYSDLVVGAPFYSGSIGDEGRVYVYISRQPPSGPRQLMLSSNKNPDGPGLRGRNNGGARFGWVVANAGDLNDDDFEDFVVGAPLDQPDLDGDGFGNGAIYVYHGRADGNIEEYKQVITAETVGSFLPKKLFKQFGYSVAGNRDTNNDQYPDIVIGAYESAAVLLLRTRPVMDVKATLTLSKNTILVGNFTPNCKDNNIGRQCLDAEVCFRYLGKGVTKKQTLKYTFELDKERSLKRVYFLDGRKKQYAKSGTIDLPSKNVTVCRNFTQIFVEGNEQLTRAINIGNNNIVFQTSYELVSPPQCNVDTLCPVFDPSSDNKVVSKALLIFNCSDNTCNYDLVTGMSLKPESIFLGVTESLEVTITLTNKDEVAYNPSVSISHHPSLQYVRNIVVDKSFRIEHSAAPDLNNETARDIFRLLGPLGRDKKVVFKVEYSTERVTDVRRELVVHAHAFGDSNQESNPSDNNATRSVQVRREVVMELNGRASPKSVNYPASMPALNAGRTGNGTDFSSLNASDIGAAVTVTFGLRNAGKSTLESIRLSISYPLKKLNGDPQDYYVYPLNITANGQGACEKTVLNPEKFNLVESNVQSRRKRAVAQLSHRSEKGGVFTCHIRKLASRDSFSVIFTFRLWTRTFVKSYPKDFLVRIEASALFQDALDGKSKNKFNQVDIRVTPQNAPGKKKSTPVWVIIVSILGGVLLLALAIFALFKLGFFKRNRPPKDISAPQTDDGPPAPQI